MGIVLDDMALDNKLLRYPIYDTFYISADSLGEELPVLRQRYKELNEQDVLQISLVVLAGTPTVPLGKDSVVMYMKQVLRGEQECIIESDSLSSQELSEKYPWFWED